MLVFTTLALSEVSLLSESRLAIYTVEAVQLGVFIVKFTAKMTGRGCMCVVCAAVGEGLSYLPPGYAYSPDPETAPALAAGIATEAAAPAAHGKGTKSRAAAQGAAAARGGGRGSKRKAAAAEQQQQREGDDDAVQQPKRARAAAGAKGRSKGRNKAADADGDDGWGSDSGGCDVMRPGVLWDAWCLELKL